MKAPTQGSKRRSFAAAKEILQKPAYEEKRQVTLYLNRETFAELQSICGRKTSQVIDSLIADFLSSPEAKSGRRRSE
jgi:hypothetical protein